MEQFPESPGIVPRALVLSGKTGEASALMCRSAKNPCAAKPLSALLMPIGASVKFNWDYRLRSIMLSLQ